MDTIAVIPNLAGATLADLTFSWQDARAEMVVHPSPSLATPSGALHLRVSEIKRFIVPREAKSPEPASIRAVSGPCRLDDETLHLRLELASGDLIEFDFGTLDLLPSIRVTAPEAPLPEHPPLPHLHDARLAEIRLSPEQKTADLVAGPVLWLVQKTQGGSHVRLHFRGVLRVIYPRRTPWDYSSTSILELRGPVKLAEGVWHLRLVMQDGNEVEFDYEAVDIEPFNLERDD